MIVMRIIVLATLLLCLPLAAMAEAIDSAQSGYTPIQHMTDGESEYERGVAGKDRAALDTALAEYTACRDTLEADLGLDSLHAGLGVKAQFMVAWCQYRLAEISNSIALFDSARAEFAKVPRHTGDYQGPVAAFMVAELEARPLRADLDRALCTATGLLEVVEAENLRRAYGQVAAAFDSLAADTAARDLLRVGATYRARAIRQDSIVLGVAAGDTAGVGAALRDRSSTARLSDYELDSSERRAFEDMLAYQSGLATWQAALVDGDVDGVDTSAVWSARVSARERELRSGLSLLASSDFAAAVDRLDGASLRRTYSEAFYWQGLAQLLATTDDEALDAMGPNRYKALDPVSSLRRSSADFDSFINAAQRSGRLGKLGALADQRRTVLQITLDRTDPVGAYERLGRQDLKFLMQSALSISDWNLDSCLARLDRFLTSQIARGGSPEAELTSTLSDCAAGVRTALDTDELRFYHGLVLAQQAFGLDSIDLSVEVFNLQNHDSVATAGRAAADILEAVDGPYANEARYLAARCLFLANDQSEARALLRPLIEHYGSTRAAYWYGASLREELRGAYSKDDIANIRTLMQEVRDAIDRASTPPGYQGTRSNASSMLGKSDLASRGGTANLDSLGLGSLVCPERLAVIDSGLPTEEVVLYETFTAKRVVREQWLREAIREIVLFSLPAASPYPSTRTCLDTTVDNRYEQLGLEIVVDTVSLDLSWHARIVFHGGFEGALPKLDTVHVRNTTRDQGLKYRWDGNVCVVDSIRVKDTLEVCVEPDGYYPRCVRYTHLRPGEHPLRPIPLTPVVRYEIAQETPCEVQRGCIAGFAGHNRFLPPDHSLPAALRDSLAGMRSLRAFCYDEAHERFLTIADAPGRELLVFLDDSVSTWMLKHDLVSPEGVAVDDAGRIYIADWSAGGTGRVVVLDSVGNLERQLDQFLEDETGEAPSRLIYPSRLAFEAGSDIVIDGVATSFDDYILVSDRYGIHRFDTYGRYIGPVEIEGAAPAGGAITEVKPTGYAGQGRLTILDRADGMVWTLTPKR